MALLGVLARLDTAQQSQIVQRLELIDGVSTFSVEEAERIGILVEQNTLDAAHAVLVDRVKTDPGILGVWPVFAHGDEEQLEENSVPTTA